ncbi:MULTISPECIES: ABC transporter permease [unclassified Halanaerobium]|uniref:ABC transporter permease n=1 Tax=unclassified Halanaerobium TaxID=2641197 RepID=UPI000DF2E65D|nr:MULTISPECIES: ABC transporter permease [unclassified Halanaerobium]RCW47790.1 peptide/nickel transport system permease protein [Halanaerobium sp. MA284_MarDTE_T2]RCW79414.1 peptide/nickel transport system permease protein [Halanaerobium sp. DL-01]
MREKLRKALNSDLFYSYKNNKLVILASIVLLLIVFSSVFAAFIAPHDPYNLASVSLMDSMRPPSWMEGGVGKFVFGSDLQGRGVLSTILYGTRISIMVGLAAVALGGTVGVTLGMISGYFGGKVDSVIMRMADVQLSFPTTMIAITVMAFWGRGILKLIIVIGLATWVTYARTARGSTLSLKNSEFIEAAKLIGVSKTKIIMRHVLPNILTPIIVIATVQIAQVIMLEATLSFLGMGVPLTEPSLGLMISDGYKRLLSGSWWLVIFPGAVLVMIVLSINVIGDWLRDTLNPKLK